MSKTVMYRSFSTSIRRLNETELRGILEKWPARPENATPYEILGLSKHTQIDPKQLKAHFHKFAKLYHPDSGDDFGLEPQVRDERFKKALAAYQILRDPHKRTLYDNHRTGWNHGAGTLRTKPASGMYYPPRRHSAFDSNGFRDYQYDFAGNWEDFYRMKNRPDYKQNFEKNKRAIFMGVLAFTLVYTALQVTHIAYYPIEDVSGEAHDQTERDLRDAHNNYGFGLDKLARINRFLWFRHLSTVLIGVDSADIKKVPVYKDNGKGEMVLKTE